MTTTIDRPPSGEETGPSFPSVGRGELLVWGVLIAIALGTRFWDLGGRAMHYDEVLHVWYSWLFAHGEGYEHNPLTHGPFLYHANALVYLIFGANDVTSRLVPALFGVALVGAPYLLRRELGRYGALATSVLILASPTLLYFSRFIRNDVYMAVYAAGLVFVMVRYWERPRTHLLVIWVALWALAFSTKETAFLLAGIFGLFLLIVSARHYWQWVKGNAKLSDLPPSGALFLVLATVSAPLWAPMSGLIQGLFDVILVNPDAADPRVMAGDLFRANVATGEPAGGARYIAAVLVLAMSAVAVTLGLLWDRRRWPILLAVFIAIWLPLHTSLFTHWDGFFTGLWGSLGYWIAQHGVERANQPMHYYLVTMLTYEFLILAAALGGGIYLLARGKIFDIFLVYFAFMSFFIFSFAGERMPWLTVGIAFPAALVAGKAIGLLIESLRQAHLGPAGFIAGLGLTFMVPFAFVRAVTAPALFSDAGLWFAVLGTILVALAAAVTARRLLINAEAHIPGMPFAYRPHAAPTLAAMALGALVVLLGVTIPTSIRVAYSHAQYERPTEMLVFSQTGQETVYARQCMERIAYESGRGRDGIGFLVGQADNFAWQWRWYLRDVPNVQYRTFGSQPLTAPPDVDVVLIPQVDEWLVAPQLEDFSLVGNVYHLWWFPQPYAALTPAALWNGLTDRATLQTVIDYFFTRSWHGTPMHRTMGHVYVTNDLAPLAEGCTSLRAAQAD